MFNHKAPSSASLAHLSASYSKADTGAFELIAFLGNYVPSASCSLWLNYLDLNFMARYRCMVKN